MDHKEIEQKMQKTLNVLVQDLGAINAGRVSATLLKPIQVALPDNVKMNLTDLGHIRVIDSKTLGITVWDEGNVAMIEKAIKSSNLGVHPQSAGADIRLIFPDLTQERRKELVKILHDHALNAKNALRDIRHEALKEHEKESKDLSDEEKRKFKDTIQKIIDKFNDLVKKAVDEKEKEILKI